MRPTATRLSPRSPTPAPAQAQPTPGPTTVPDPGMLSDAVDIASEVSQERLLADVAWLADDARQGRLAGGPGEDEAGAWLAERMAQLKLAPFAAAGLDDFSQPFSLEDRQAENIVAVLPGAAEEESCVMLGAHYDHMGVQNGVVYNGADDDASGVAAVLEAARVLVSAGLAPRATIVFVAFSAEEQGGLGSEALGRLLGEKGLAQRCQLLNLEMLGAAQGQGTYLDVWDEGDDSTARLVEAVQLAGTQLGVPVKQQGRDPGSDALVLLDQGIPAVSLDVAWGDGRPHPHYHQPSDDVEYIDGEGLTRATRVAVAAGWLLANDSR